LRGTGRTVDLVKRGGRNIDCLCRKRWGRVGGGGLLQRSAEKKYSGLRGVTKGLEILPVSAAKRIFLRKGAVSGGKAPRAKG